MYMFCDGHDGSVSWYVCVHRDGISGEELCCRMVLHGAEFLVEVVAVPEIGHLLFCKGLQFSVCPDA